MAKVIRVEHAGITRACTGRRRRLHDPVRDTPREGSFLEPSRPTGAAHDGAPAQRISVPNFGRIALFSNADVEECCKSGRRMRMRRANTDHEFEPVLRQEGCRLRPAPSGRRPRPETRAMS